MTVITVAALEGRLSLEQRRKLSQTLTDAVLVPEVGQAAPAARIGFQVHFVERARDQVAIGGVLVEALPIDVMLVDIAVMEASWLREVRAQVIANVYSALTDALEVAEPAPGWWVNFRVIDEGSWGSRGTTLSVLSLLDSGVFTPERAAAIRADVSSD